MVWSAARAAHGLETRVTGWAVVLFACLFGSVALADAAAPPNIVMIVSDDQAWTDYSFMGHATVRTPHLDKLASQGVTFKRGYVPSSLCCPSLASIITGQYPHQHKVTSNDPPVPQGAGGRKSKAFAEGRETMNRFMDAAPALPRLLEERGYVSFQSGKWWQGDFRRGGFTHGMTQGARHGDAGLSIGRETMKPIFDFMDEAKSAGKPFMVWYAPMMPHTPHDPPERIMRNYAGKAPSESVARYWAMIEWFDETCGALLDRLDAQDLAENTIVVYVTDNGWIQDPKSNHFAPKSKQSPYDGGVRTPIMVRWPAKLKPRMADELAHSIDLAPTILKAAGLMPPAGMTGVDLLDEAAVKSRTAVFGECFTHDAVDLNVPASSLRWRWVVDGNWKLIAPHAANEPNAKPELYDLAADPHEEKDLAAAAPDRVQSLTRRLDERWTPGG